MVTHGELRETWSTQHTYELLGLVQLLGASTTALALLEPSQSAQQRLFHSKFLSPLRCSFNLLSQISSVLPLYLSLSTFTLPEIPLGS